MRALFIVKTIWILPVISGILLILTLPIANMHVIAWIALVPLFFFIDKVSTKKKVFIGGTITGTIYGIAVLLPLWSLNAWWWVSSGGFLWEYKEELLLTFLIIVGIISGGMLVGVFSALYKKFSQYTIISAFIFGLLWAFFEFAREWFVYGFTWGHFGYSQSGNILLLQLAYPFGVYGLSFLIVTINILIYLSLRHAMLAIKADTSLLHNSITSISKNYCLVVLFTVLIISHIYGFFLLTTDGVGKNSLQVAVIYSNLTTKDSQGLQGYRTNMILIQKSLAINPDIVVIPENTFPFFIIDLKTNLPVQYENEYSSIRGLYDTFRQVSLDNPATSFVLGIHSKQGEQQFNSLAVMEKGEITSIYHKQVLMPFSEATTQRFSKNHIRPVAKGLSNQNITVQNILITPLICSEIIYPRLAEQEKSSFIINISNESMFESPLVARQNHIMARFRAVENRQYLLRSIKGGVASIINPFGNVEAQSENNNQIGILVGEILY